MPHCTSRFCLTVRFCKIYTFHQDGRLSSRICDRHLAQRRNHVFSELEDVISNLAVEQVNSFSSVRAAIISPSPATYRLASQGQRSLVHPFVSFQMTIKMGRGQADWKSSNISVQPAPPGIGNPPPLLLQIPLKLLSSLWFTTVPVVDFLNVIWAISRQKLNRIAASDRLFTPISIRKAMQIEIVVFLFWDIGPQPYYWLWCRQQNRLQTPSLHDPQIPQHRPQISADESVHPYSMHPLNTFSIITSHVCFQILPYLLFLFATPYLFPYQQKN